MDKPKKQIVSGKITIALTQNLTAPATLPRIIATCNHVDENGHELFEVVRFEPKSFRQRRPDGCGGHIWNLDGVRPVLHRLPELIRAVASGCVVFVVKGEKDADNLSAIGITETTNPMGAGKWRDDFGEFLRRADVVVLPDNDPHDNLGDRPRIRRRR